MDEDTRIDGTDRPRSGTLDFAGDGWTDDQAWDHIVRAATILGRSALLDSLDIDDALAGTRSTLECFVARPELAVDTRLEACRLLFAVHQDQSRRLHKEAERTIASVQGLRRAVDNLLDVTTEELVEEIPLRICRQLGFGRAMISSIRSAVWLPRRLYVDGDDSPANPAFQSYVTGARIPLFNAPLETEIVRTRMPTMSRRPDDDRRTFKELVEVAHSVGYVAAPIIARGRVIAILHADRPRNGDDVSESDLDTLSAFGECLSVVFERAILADRLRLSSTRVNEMFGDITSQLSDIAHTTTSEPQADAPVSQLSTPPDTSTGAIARHAPGFLTPREREVLTHMATGATNAQIARALVISEETVKSHLKQISKKLGTSNRSAAVARFTQLNIQLAIDSR